MAYTHKPGYGRMFSNTEKRNPKAPDYSGTAALPDGRVIKLAGWRQGLEDNINIKIEALETTSKPSHLTAQQRQWEQEGKSIFTGIPQRKDEDDF